MSKIILLTILLISAVGITFSAPSNSDPVKETYNTNDGKMFKVTSNGLYTFNADHVSWGEARRRCDIEGLKLAEISSQNALETIQAELKLTRAYDNAWVGGRGAQPGEYNNCGFFWNEKGDEITLAVQESNGACDPKTDRQSLRVEVGVKAGLKARDSSSILPYICQH